MRLAWHPEADVVVLSLWHGDHCTASFRLAISEVPRMVQALVEGLAAIAAPGSSRAPHAPASNL